jgi:predicted metal-dependent hydrolase
MLHVTACGNVYSGAMSITYKLKRSKKARAMRLAVYPDGEVVVTAPYFFGVKVIEHFFAKHIEWVRRKVEETRGKTVIRVPRADIPMLKKRALELADMRCRHFAQLYGVEYGTITVRAQKTRWGSCSAKGDLSFNYRLAAVPAHIADYIVVHELCHLLELNHSKKFWAHVERTVPEHKKIRKEMRELVMMFF